jgi:putative glutamine amidotransferase
VNAGARPLIGLTTYAEPARFGLLETYSAVLPMAYVRAVHGSGGRAVLVPPDDPGTDILDTLDGIVFTGGADVDPGLYGEAAHEATTVRPVRDAAELPLLRAALAADLPVLGVCRGMQLMVVAAGGRLYQHLPDTLGHAGHRPGGSMGEHPVRLAPGSRCQAILGDWLTVNSLHHQGVADPGTLTPVGWCPDDELIEAVENPRRSFALGVQWHVEETPDRRLFQALVQAAAGRRVTPADPSGSRGAPAVRD